MAVYRFGFLDQNETYRFEGGQIDPCGDFVDRRLWVAQNAHKDGYIYPGIAWNINVLAMGLNPSPSGEAFRFFALLEFGGGKVPNEFAQPL
jgi:hypothetical protein